jgi:hypothetical protein
MTTSSRMSIDKLKRVEGQIKDLTNEKETSKIMWGKYLQNEKWDNRRRFLGARN